MRIAIIGNAGAGKSTLARDLAQRTGLPHIEIDRMLWQPGWVPAPDAAYDHAHHAAVSRDRWIIDGMGRDDSLEQRLIRATHVILIDPPLSALEDRLGARQTAWRSGQLRHRPGGQDMPPDDDILLELARQIDRETMPHLRQRVRTLDADVVVIRDRLSPDVLLARVCGAFGLA